MTTITNAHNDLIHDAVLDYYGKRLATCSSDKTIKIFDIDGAQHRLVETLVGHEGPVWQVSWAHPKFGVILASGSYDGKALLWREAASGSGAGAGAAGASGSGNWTRINTKQVHQGSVNSVAWSPQEYGALLLCASSDGQVSVVEFKGDAEPESVCFPAHSVGVNAASWAPYTSNKAGNAAPRRFVSGGCDNLVKIWKYDTDSNSYVNEATLEGHSDWVRDVAWSPSVLSKNYIASASQDKTVIIWSQEGDGPWEKKLLKSDKFPDVVWRVSWSLSGNVLAVSGGDNKVTLWKENLNGDWEPAGEVEE